MKWMKSLKLELQAHWKYKGIKSGKRKLDWVQELLEFNQSVDNNNEFMNVVKNDLDMGGVFVFLPMETLRENSAMERHL